MTHREPAPSTDPRIGYLDGYHVAFHRRRYGRTTYTYLLAGFDGEPARELACDPWPCLSPKRAEIHAEVLRCLYGVEGGSDVQA